MENLDLYKDFEEQPFLFRRHREAVLEVPEKVRGFRGENILLTGIATSLSAWKSAYSLLCTQTDAAPLLLNTCDLLDYFYPQDRDERPVFVMSRSGDSAEIVRLAQTGAAGRKMVGITEGADSALARRADLTLLYQAGERAFPNTGSFTLSQLYALAVIIGLGYSPSGPLEELLGILEGESAKFCRTMEAESRLGELLAKAKAILVEGQGIMTGVAEQAALDFHETRTAGIPVVGGIMRHGAVELTEAPGTVTILLVPDDRAAGRKIQLAKDLCESGKEVVVMTDMPLCSVQGAHMVYVPEVPVELKSIFFTFGMQKLYGSYTAHKKDVPLQPALVGKVTRRE